MPDDKTQRLISKWQINTNALKQAEDNLELAKAHLSRSTAELGNWLTPGDTRIGELFHIWVNGSILEIRARASKDEYLIRYRPTRKEEE